MPPSLTPSLPSSLFSHLGFIHPRFHGMPLVAPRSPRHGSSTQGWLSPSLLAAAERLQMPPCPSARAQPPERRGTGGKPEPEGREREDELICLPWLRPRFRCAPDAKLSPRAPCQGGRLQPSVARQGLSSRTFCLGPGGSLHLPKGCGGNGGEAQPETPRHAPPSLEENGSLVLCRRPRHCPAPGQEASCYPGSPGSDLIRIKWKHLESRMMDKVCTTCL